MATVKARLQDVARNLGKIERRWVQAIRECGSAYAEAYRKHVASLPTQLPPDAHMVLIGKVVGSVAGTGTGAVLSPVVAAVITPILTGEIEDFATKLGSHRKPGKLAMPTIDTPQKYQNDYLNYVSRIFGYLEDVIDRLLEIVDGITRSRVQITHDDVDTLIGIINRSPLVHAPAGSASWNENGRLEDEMEKAMWAAWCLRLGEGKGKKLLHAADLDLAPPLKRMQELGLLNKGISASDGFKVRLSVAILMLKWARRYKPQRRIAQRLPEQVQRTARMAMSRYANQSSSLPTANRQLRRMMLDGTPA